MGPSSNPVARGCVLLCAAFALCACADPTVDVVVAWASALDGVAGKPALEVYDHGQRYSQRIDAALLEPDPSIDAPIDKDLLERELALRIDVDSRARVVALTGPRLTRFESVREGRVAQLSRDDVDAPLAADLVLLRNGDALLRGYHGDANRGQLLMLTSSMFSGEIFKLQFPRVRDRNYALVGASDAPVFVWIELPPVTDPVPVPRFGKVVAYAYPSDFAGDIAPVQVPTLLGEMWLTSDLGAHFINSWAEVADTWCPGRVCVAPGGTSLTTMGPTRCEILWWHLGRAEPQSISLADACPSDPFSPTITWPIVFMQLAQDVVALMDSKRIYVADLTTGTVRSAPKLWDSPGKVIPVQRGRAAVVLSPNSQVIRIDTDGPRLLSTDYLPCAPGRAVASPSGLWVLSTCSEDGAIVGGGGRIVRISPLGLETFYGVTMEPVAIDDAGNGMLYSADTSDDGEPRGLFVLASDGTVNRVDPLEPEPSRVLSSRGIERYLAAPAMPAR